MGQSASSQREREEVLHRDSRRFSQLVQDRESRSTPSLGDQRAGHQEPDHSPSTASTRHSQPQEVQQTQPFATFSRQISAQSVPVRGGVVNNGDTSTRDEIFYEQQEVRSLVHMEDLGMRNAPITHITASPMPRRNSVISRLSSRLLPRYLANSSPGNDQEGYGEGRSTRRRLSDRLPSSSPEESGDTQHHRFSLLGPLSPGSSTSSRARRRRELTSLSGQFPLTVDGSVQPPNLVAPALETSSSEGTSMHGQQHSALETAPLLMRNSRLSRVRRSLSNPLETLLSPTRNQTQRDSNSQSTPRRPLGGTVTNDPGYSLPPLSAPELNIDLNNSSLEPTRSNNREQGMPGFLTAAGPSENPPAWPENPWTERWAERSSAGRREPRRMRGRPSRLVRRDDEGPLPRILHLAATAIAAQLSGTPEQAITNMQAIGADGLDGSLNALFRTLQHGTTSVGDERPADGASETNRPPGTLPPLNFLRVFRFVNQTSDGAATSRSRAQDRSTPATSNEDTPDGSDGRTVTLVVVGVRSVPSENLGHEDTPVTEPSLDALLSLPMTPSNNILRNGASGLLRHADGRPRFSHRRRASMGGLNTFPANYDSQRHQRMLNPSRQGSIDANHAEASTVPSSLSESPPGPHPPPSTPADPGLSAYSSGTTTPNRRPSSASAAQHAPLPNRDTAAHHLRDAGILVAEDQMTRTVQQRRRSDSEFARHRDLGAGAARRNGVVEPDDVEPGEPPPQGSRSWLIYVVGTNLSEDHPAFATPSLFTDVSYVIGSCYTQPNRLFRIPLMRTCFYYHHS